MIFMSLQKVAGKFIVFILGHKIIRTAPLHLQPG
jgi:hypothetical protein